MKTIEQLEAEHAKALVKLKTEHAFALRIRDIVGRDPQQVLEHEKFISCNFDQGLRKEYSPKDAAAILEKFAPFLVIAEHWKGGCVSCWPAEINGEAKNERATLQGRHAVELKMSAGDGYSSHEFSMWARIDGRLVDIGVRITPNAAWLPNVICNRDERTNRILSYTVQYRSIGEDSRLKWWSEQGSYSLTYYWADLPNWTAWASSFTEPKTQVVHT